MNKVILNNIDYNNSLSNDNVYYKVLKKMKNNKDKDKLKKMFKSQTKKRKREKKKTFRGEQSILNTLTQGQDCHVFVKRSMR